MTDESIGTENTMRKRANESRLKLWFFLGANRLVVTGVLAAVVFCSFVALGMFVYPPFRETVGSTDVVETMFSTMLSAVITGVTLVVTISQLVISQENGPLGDQRTRMSDMMDFRAYSEELIGSPAPADPSAFLSELIRASGERAERLRASVAGNSNADLVEEVETFTESVIGNADEVRDQIEGAQFGTFDVLFAALNYNYGRKIYQTERLADDYADDLDADLRERLDELRTSFVMFGPAREHIKTLYFEWALIDLTQLILYAAIPALVVSGAMLAFVGEGTLLGNTLGADDILLLVGAAFTVTLLPFLLLTSYILRIATVAKRTLAIGPLILRESQQ